MGRSWQGIALPERGETKMKLLDTELFPRLCDRSKFSRFVYGNPFPEQLSGQSLY